MPRANQYPKCELPYTTYYKIGKEQANKLSTKLEYHRIAKMMNLSAEAARKISMVALGKVIYGLKKELTASDIM